ncbi:hypothetical protein [Halobacillus sp. BBL2006]|uniref:hypothetical protein n=1 Tax=Halobacillus sp. BBL2006 TaxID=1543706 RepID=UPI00054318FE|nr:hypothetical protein [Halobacillus sp. BBL2006]KHE70676.1 hypothetical protein LD39_11335 [Halobacillus sp. BBL2006]
MNKEFRVKIGLFSSLLLCLVGLYDLIAEETVTSIKYFPIILVIAGFIGAIGNYMELKKINKTR